MRAAPTGRALPALITIQKGLTTLRWTTWAEDIVIGENTWIAASGAKISSMAFCADGTESNADITIMTKDGGLVEPGDGARGVLDGWPISIMLFDPSDVEGTATEMVPGSTIGSVAEDSNGLATIEARGPLTFAGRPVTEHFSLTGREDLGDERCTIDLTLGAGWTFSTTGEATGTFTVVLDTLPDARASDETWYVNGGLIVKSGPLSGFPKIPIMKWNPGTLTVTLALPVAISDIPPGTDLDLHPGCDNTAAMCFSRFDNIANLRAETFVPPPDVML